MRPATRRWRIPLVAFALAGSLGAANAPQPSVDQVLEQALHQRTAIDTLRRFTLTLRTATGRSESRQASVATKEYEGELYVLGVFSHPQDLRGTAFLTIDGEGASDHFVYFPAFRRIRRVTAYQKSDPWFGTDLSIEDLERRHASDYQIFSTTRTKISGEPAQAILARPLYGSRYDRIRFTIADKDHVILRTEYYRGDRETPSKIVEAAREGLVMQRGAAVPKRLLCRNLDTGTETEITLDEVVFSPEIQQEFFTARTLELRSKLRFLE